MSDTIDKMLDRMVFRDAIRRCCREGISESEAAAVFERYRISQDIADDENDAPAVADSLAPSWQQGHGCLSRLALQFGPPIDLTPMSL
jgi:hypothetical protein